MIGFIQNYIQLRFSGSLGTQKQKQPRQASITQHTEQQFHTQPKRDEITIRFGNQANNTQPNGPQEIQNTVSTQTTTAPETKVHMVNGVPYKTPQGQYQMVVEIPSGTNEKWQTDPVTGEFYHDKQDGIPRVINFLPYPMNYGIVPQTILPKSKGGDGDPIDIVTLAPACPRGWNGPVKIIGALKLSERGETDTKIVAVLPNGPFKEINDLPELLMKHPGALEIVKNWFEGYKGPGSFLFEGYASKAEAERMVEESHQSWLEEMARTPQA
jgi:inorganic pyrophosphatase